MATRRSRPRWSGYRTARRCGAAPSWRRPPVARRLRNASLGVATSRPASSCDTTRRGYQRRVDATEGTPRSRRGGRYRCIAEVPSEVSIGAPGVRGLGSPRCPSRSGTQRTAAIASGETSPYLLQHAHNPVDWFPWGPDALARARLLDRPIFLSIGYAACHWCHVMERESFEDESTAAFLNERFIAIKVDREERPDLDQVYMGAVQALTGSGGWPMSVFLTPEGRPFYGGTYFPDTPRARHAELPAGPRGHRSRVARAALGHRGVRGTARRRARRERDEVRQQVRHPRPRCSRRPSS